MIRINIFNRRMIRAKKPIEPVDPGKFLQLENNDPRIIRIWGVSFEIGQHIYSIRVEEVDTVFHGINYIAYNHNLDNLIGDKTYFVKFDNYLNEIVVGGAYKRLPPCDNLTISEFCLLEKNLVGGIRRFMDDYKVPLVVGIPNDKKLERWYINLSNRMKLPECDVLMCGTALYSYSVVVIHRRDVTWV